jgi:sugar phosphate isomerase/epimerase
MLAKNTYERWRGKLRALRFSCSTITWQSVSTKEKFAKILSSIRAIGYSGVEIEYRLLPLELAKDASLTARLIEAAGLEIASVSLVDTASGVEFVSSVGAKNATLCLFEKNIEIAETKVSAVLAGMNGINLSLHPHIRSNLETIAQIDSLLRKYKSSLLKVCFDSAHAMALGIDPIHFLHHYGKVVSHIHLKDFIPGKTIQEINVETDFVDINDGAIDFPPILRTVQTIQYEGWLSVEVDHPQEKSAELSAKKNYERLNDLVARTSKLTTDFYKT